MFAPFNTHNLVFLPLCCLRCLTGLPGHVLQHCSVQLFFTSTRPPSHSHPATLAAPPTAALGSPACGFSSNSSEFLFYLVSLLFYLVFLWHLWGLEFAFICFQMFRWSFGLQNDDYLLLFQDWKLVFCSVVPVCVREPEPMLEGLYGSVCHHTLVFPTL